MAKLVTYKVPALDKGKIVYLDKQGITARLYVGNVQEHFVLQVDADGKPECLVHYPTGQKFGGSLARGLSPAVAPRLFGRHVLGVAFDHQPVAQRFELGS